MTNYVVITKGQFLGVADDVINKWHNTIKPRLPQSSSLLVSGSASRPQRELPVSRSLCHRKHKKFLARALRSKKKFWAELAGKSNENQTNNNFQNTKKHPLKKSAWFRQQLSFFLIRYKTGSYNHRVLCVRFVYTQKIWKLRDKRSLCRSSEDCNYLESRLQQTANSSWRFPIMENKQVKLMQCTSHRWNGRETNNFFLQIQRTVNDR